MAFDTRLLNGVGTLAAVVDAGSFARAAEALGLSSSAVSRAVARMEQRLGLRLFDRTSRALALTDEGRRFYQRVLPMLDALEDAATHAAGAAAEVRGRLRVNLHPWVARHLLPPHLPRFVEAHPRLRLELVVRDRLGDLVGDGFDAAVRFGLPESSSLIARQLARTRIVTCAAPAYLARRGLPRHPLELAGGRHECIFYLDPADGRPFPWEFHRGGDVLAVPVAGHVSVNDQASHLQACLAGLGIVQTLEAGVAEALRDGRLVQLFPDWAEETYPLYAYYPSRRLPAAKLKAFLALVTEGVGDSAVAPGAAPAKGQPEQQEQRVAGDRGQPERGG